MLKNLKLERPIAFIDVETTGTNPHSDRVVELSILRIQPDGKEEYKSHRVNPGVPIPPEATAVHGITVLSISEMGHFLNRTLWHDQAALTSSLRPWL